ncbi:unnamed protein product, partial [Medioppia subpectinata]
MKNVLEFEKRLAQITIPADQRRDDESTYHKMTLKELKMKCKAIDWVSYYRRAFGQIGREITENEQIVIYSPQYMSNLSDLIEEHLRDEQKKIVVANYLGWSVVQTMTSCLAKPFREASKILRKALMGSEGTESPWRYCVTDTNGVMGFALGAMFVKAVFHGDSKLMAQTMIEEVRDAFKNNLPNLKWMDEHTRQLAKEKAPFYDVNYPKSLNFGAMGVVMGHELSHAFDGK